MPRPKKLVPDQLSLLEARTSTAPCVPAIRKAVAEWKAGGCKGVTATTRTLLNFWFNNDHRHPNGRKFAYHHAQREAVETLIYLFEVAKVRRQKDLVETYYNGDKELRLSQHDDFARYCVKMATGSGKTKVMSLAIAWQYFNAQLEPNGGEYAKTFLLIAPNVIVFERLRSDFGSGRIFRTDPVIPPELRLFWDFDVYLRGDAERASSDGGLYLTNIQQMHDRANRGSAKDDEADPMAAVLGSKPPTQKIETVDFAERIAAREGNCVVLNDEAHHTHDEKLKWNEVIRDLHISLSSPPLSEERAEGRQGGATERAEGRQGGATERAEGRQGGATERAEGRPGGAVLQLDVTATPRYNKGGLFTWTIFDYPLKQAIIDNIVKRPMKGIVTGMQEAQSDIASVRYQAFLVAGVERWREYRKQLKPLGKKPLLFVMLNDTAEADDVADYLRTKYPDEFGGDSLLVIHTDNTGEVSKKDLDAARGIARQADDIDSPVNAIVSVLMLREGWDVQNVTVVVGLRPYSSKANILPEQTIGRGLRLMFRDQNANYVERVDIIGNKKFIEFIDQLEKDEDLTLDTFEVGKEKLVVAIIEPDAAKIDKDILLPKLTPILSRKKTLGEEIAALDISTFRCPIFPKKENDDVSRKFQYEGHDIITLEKLIQSEYTVPAPQTSQEVISYYAKRIAQDVKLPSQFAALVPKVREFLETRAFGEVVSLDSPAMIKAIASNVAHYVTVKTFASALQSLVVEEKAPELENAGRPLSQTPPYPFSRPTFASDKTVFNLVAADNEFERQFAKFLHDSGDVSLFAKLPSQFGFAIEYTDNATNLRYYEPDFVAVLTDDTHYLIETKGREDIDVAHKDRSASIWCENATLLTGTLWRYIKVAQGEFDKLKPDAFSDLYALAPSS